MLLNVLRSGGLQYRVVPKEYREWNARYCFCWIWLILVIIMMAVPAFAGNRLSTDTITLKNGDVITCEIRSLEKGQLTIKQPNASSTVVLDWKSIAKIQSQQSFVVIDTNTKTFSGTIHQDAVDSVLQVEGPVSAAIPHNLVVSIEETNPNFFRRLRGNVDLGMSFSQSNSQTQVTLQGSLASQTVKHILGATMSTQFTSQLETNNTRETDIKTEYFSQIRQSRWANGAIANFLSSSAQKINLRTSVGGAIAFQGIKTNKTELIFIGGVAYTIEQNSIEETNSRSNSVDTAWAVQYSTFRFDSTDFDTTIWLYPSISQAGRLRMTLNEDVYVKFYKDFYVRGSFYDNYDNQPTVTAPANNLGTSLTVGWSFR